MNRKLLATAICSSLLIAGTAYAATPAPAPQAQDQTTTSRQESASNAGDEQAKPPQTLEAVTVTGSLLRRPEYETTMPVQVVPIEADVAAGQFGITSFVQTTAAAGSASQINGQFGAFVIDGGVGVQPINLRGLGASRTLVLLDGQRPGPAGTRGAVNDFDLNVIPTAIIGRIAIVKDGSSSIYGSDAIAGVVNLITKKRLDHTVLDFFTGVPQHGGGQQYSGSIATGWNFKNGNITAAAQVQQQQRLEVGERSYLRCARDRVWGPDGNRVDWPDRSINQGTQFAGCDTNGTIYDMLINALTGERWVPTLDGSTGPGSPAPGFHLSQRKRYDQVSNPADAFNDQPGTLPQLLNSDFISFNQNASFWLAPSFTFGNVQWNTQLLLDRRITRDHNWQQFFPVVANNHGFSSADQSLLIDALNGNGQLWEPIMVVPSNTKIRDDYGYLRTALSGGFGDSSWAWAVNVHASQSDGDYSTVAISNARSGDLNTDDNEITGNTLVNYFDPGFLSGANWRQLQDAVGQAIRGTTIYKQQDANAVFNGNLVDLPAGPATAAVGAEFRHYSIDDKAPPMTWGFTSAGETKGADNVKEVFGELGVPILKGLPGAQSLSVDMSLRQFRYNSVGKSAHVWKYGLSWQPIPTFRVRGSIGTSYRAPGLFQLYLADQTGFAPQLSIDPCIDWAESPNQDIQKNCAAAGIPGNFAGTGPSVKVISGGGKGHLTPETSRAKSLGFVWSPTFANLQVAVDYFDYNIRGEIAQLTAGTIATSCYNKPEFPNTFCELLTRNSSTAAQNPNVLTSIHSVYINVNQERDRGYDVQMNYEQDFPIGTIKAAAEATYTMDHVQQVFSTAEAGGFGTNDFTGTIGTPHWYGIANVSLKRGDWMYSWQGIYTSATSDHRFVDETQTYVGMEDARIDIKNGAQLRHTVSVGWDNGQLKFLVGIRNLLDQTPPLVSPGDSQVNTVGNVALQASQYDFFGRTWFARMTVKL